MSASVNEKVPDGDVESAYTLNELRSPPAPSVPLPRPELTAGYRPNGGNSRAKIIGEFRTLSIHVTDTKEGRPDKSIKKDVSDLSTLEWHNLSTDEVATRVGVSPKTGLDTPMAARRLTQNGKNVISPPPRNLAKKIFFYIFPGFGSLLFIGSVICFIAWRPLGDPNPSAANLALAVILLLVILLQAGFNAWQDFSTGRVMASITGMLPTDILVTRDGETFNVPAANLVLGDIVKITLGSKVPADLRLIEVSSDLRFDRSILTGESNAIAATLDATDINFMESRNIALQGTLCTSGSGVGICVGLGDYTVFGRIAKQAATERTGPTPLQREIRRFVLLIASMAFTVAAIIIILWGGWLRKDHPGFISVSTLLVDCVSVAVAFIPEGLPICVTLSLTVVARAMRKSDILCKSLSTVESLGSVNLILSDKTGTLTTNKMTVASVAIGGNAHSVQEAVAMAIKSESDGESVRALAAVAGLCNDAVFEESSYDKAGDSMPVALRKVHGDATDSAVLRFSEEVSPVSDLRDSWEELGKLAFNSKNKFALKLFKSNSTNPSYPIIKSDNYTSSDLLLLVKGAPDVLMGRCSNFIDASGTTCPIDRPTIFSISSIQEDFASRGMRVLLLAKRIITPNDLELEREGSALDPTHSEDHLVALNTGLCIIGLVALVDPPRDDTAHTVSVCRRAGIRFAMVTGDFALTAASIARQVGIITNPVAEVQHLSDLPRDKPLDEIPEFNSDKELDDKLTSIVLSGPEMMTMTESQWKQVLTFDELVFARTSPQQKLQIVRTFQNGGCTVAVTGDGVNDAPALKQADVGVAVAGGSEVAMEAADLILLSNFSAIITGIEHGRLCFENLRKSITYLLPAGSFSELMPVVVNVLFGLPQALSSIQMIIICVATDTLPALSLVYEKPEADLLLRKPRDRKKDRLVNWKLMLHAYAFLGILESFASMVGAFYFGFQLNGVPFSALWLKYGGADVDPDVLAELTNKAQSIYFFNLVVMQWFNLLSTRTRRLSIFQQNPIKGRKTRNNHLFLAIIAGLALAFFFSYVPVFQNILLTRGVKAQYFFLPMAYGLVILFIDESRKWWNRGHPKSLLAKVAW
ncbi:hypothetical protein BDP27DRAFT_1290170 [Rhodocollybia butyracea]|uniref:Cation-transporting P-type ATPase N-terminal domain-containing protein n=1 Tax=Rhodocollybia butyracea TaxID=206335 RepID=A0A9P5UB88_9AGAR|nr:hypothetical protein BDP27DRAFT_1290170 [Rhodocollybia butyracea]